MEVDILKPDTGALVIERPLQSSSKGTSSRAGTSGQTTPERIQYAEPVSEGEEDEAMDMAPGKCILPPSALCDIFVYLERCS